MSLRLPLFKDHEKLTEGHLYDLAWYALGCSRWAAIGPGTQGCLAPPPGLLPPGISWNGVDVVPDGVRVRPLFMVHDGYPFVSATPTTLPIGGDVLYARLRVARRSADLADGEPGYQVEFGWGPGGPDRVYAAVTEFVRRGGTADGPTFDLVPPAATPDAVPELTRAHADLVAAARGFRAHLVRHVARSAVDRGLLMDRLERLIVHVASTPTPAILGELRLVVRAARGFFQRLRFQERPDAWPGRQDRLRDLSGPVLEYELETAQPSLAAVGLPGVLADPGPLATSAEQIRVVRDLAEHLSEGGGLWRLLADNFVPQSGEFPGGAGSVVRRFDCLGLTGSVAVELTGQDRNALYAFAAAPDVPPVLQKLPQADPRPDRRRVWRLPISARYLFLGAPRAVTVSVSPEED